MSERLVGEITFDPEYKDFYLAIREVELQDGKHIGELIAYGSDPDVVHGELRKDQSKNGNARYFFYRPLENNDREGWIVGRQV